MGGGPSFAYIYSNGCSYLCASIELAAVCIISFVARFAFVRIRAQLSPFFSLPFSRTGPLRRVFSLPTNPRKIAHFLFLRPGTFSVRGNDRVSLFDPVANLEPAIAFDLYPSADRISRRIVHFARHENPDYSHRDQREANDRRRIVSITSSCRIGFPQIDCVYASPLSPTTMSTTTHDVTRHTRRIRVRGGNK